MGYRLKCRGKIIKLGKKHRRKSLQYYSRKKLFKKDRERMNHERNDFTVIVCGLSDDFLTLREAGQNLPF